jgi:hypothetical protein
MGANIFKIEQKTSEILISWKTGFDTTVGVNNNSKVIPGGSTCFFQGKHMPYIHWTSP